MLADAALQFAIQTTAPAGCAVASLDLKVNFIRPVSPGGTGRRSGRARAADPA
jgi:acyl-coenzyme A thioesterase PaaI-like protein